MAEKIKITCPRCGHEWKASLQELEQKEVIYRGDEKKIIEVRATCPVCGTHVVVKMEE